MDTMKKDFQKVVKMFRDSLPDIMGRRWTGENWVRDRPIRPEFPKAMMTKQQMDKGTATINFGSAMNEDTIPNAVAFKTYPPFVTWCETYGAQVVGIEMNQDNRYQLRVTF